MPYIVCTAVTDIERHFCAFIWSQLVNDNVQILYRKDHNRVFWFTSNLKFKLYMGRTHIRPYQENNDKRQDIPYLVVKEWDVLGIALLWNGWEFSWSIFHSKKGIININEPLGIRIRNVEMPPISKELQRILTAFSILHVQDSENLRIPQNNFYNASSRFFIWELKSILLSSFCFFLSFVHFFNKNIERKIEEKNLSENSAWGQTS